MLPAFSQYYQHPPQETKGYKADVTEPTWPSRRSSVAALPHAPPPLPPPPSCDTRGVEKRGVEERNGVSSRIDVTTAQNEGWTPSMNAKVIYTVSSNTQPAFQKIEEQYCEQPKGLQREDRQWLEQQQREDRQWLEQQQREDRQWLEQQQREDNLKGVQLQREDKQTDEHEGAQRYRQQLEQQQQQQNQQRQQQQHLQEKDQLIPPQQKIQQQQQQWQISDKSQEDHGLTHEASVNESLVISQGLSQGFNASDPQGLSHGFNASDSHAQTMSQTRSHAPQTLGQTSTPLVDFKINGVSMFVIIYDE